MSSSSSAVVSPCFSWRPLWVSLPVREASPAGGKSAHCLRVRKHTLDMFSMRLTLTTDEKADGRHISLADKCCLFYECLITTGAVKVAVIYKSCYYLHFLSNFLLLSASRFFFRHWLCNTGDWSSSKHILRSDPRLGHFLPLQLLHHWAAVGWLWALLEYR